MKRILISSCFLAVFLTIDLGAEATSKNVRRLSSKARLFKQKSNNRENFTTSEYEQLANRFYEQNHLGTPPNIRRKMTVPVAVLYRIGKILGFKEYRVEGSKNRGIPTIDLSWPNMKRVFLKKNIKSSRVEKLKALIRDTDNFSHDNFSLTDTQMDKIIDLCLRGNNGLFNLENLDDRSSGKTYSEHFKKHLRLMLKTYTGFQRLMSLLAVSILNSTEEHAFVPGFTRIGVEKIETEDCDRDCYEPDIRAIKIESMSFEGNDYTILHEITHAYHYMILESLLGDCEIPNVLDSTNADFAGLFYPMLTEKRMGIVVKEIAVSIFEKCNIETIKSDIKGLYEKREAKDSDTIDDTKDGGIKDDPSEHIIDIFKKIVDCGLGNLVFQKEDINLNIAEILTWKMLANAIYVYCSAICGDSTVWTDTEEVLTITGLAPITDGYNTFLMEDRQNEEMHRIRQLENLRRGNSNEREYNSRGFEFLRETAESPMETTVKVLDDSSDTKRKLVRPEYNRQFRFHAEDAPNQVASMVAEEIAKICGEDKGTDTDTNVDGLKIEENIKRAFAQIHKKTTRTGYLSRVDTEGRTEDMESLFIPEDLRFKPANKTIGDDEKFSQNTFNDMKNNCGFNELHLAVLNSDANKIKLLSNNIALLDIPCKTGDTPLFFAILNKDHKMVKAICEYDQIDPNGTVIDGAFKGYTPLHLAAETGNDLAIQCLLEKGANPNAKLADGYKAGATPLHLAALRENTAGLKALLEYKPSNDQLDKYGAIDPNATVISGKFKDYTPLHFAASCGYEAAVQQLLDHGADPNAKAEDEEGGSGTALSLSVALDSTETLEKLLASEKVTLETVTDCFSSDPEIQEMLSKKIKALLAVGDKFTLKTAITCYNRNPELRDILKDNIKAMLANDNAITLDSAIAYYNSNPELRDILKDKVKSLLASPEITFDATISYYNRNPELRDILKDNIKAMLANDNAITLDSAIAYYNSNPGLQDILKDKVKSLLANDNAITLDAAIAYYHNNYGLRDILKDKVKNLLVNDNAITLDAAIAYYDKNYELGDMLKDKIYDILARGQITLDAVIGCNSGYRDINEKLKNKATALLASPEITLDTVIGCNSFDYEMREKLKEKATALLAAPEIASNIISGHYNDNPKINKILPYAVEAGNVEVIRALLASPKITLDAVIDCSAYYGSIKEMLQEKATALLATPEIASGVISGSYNGHPNINKLLGYVVDTGNVEAIEALLASPKITINGVVWCNSSNSEIKERLKNKMEQLLTNNDITLSTVVSCYTSDPEIKEMLKNKAMALLEASDITLSTVVSCYSSNPEIKEMLKNKTRALLAAPGITHSIVAGCKSYDPEMTQILP
ncbi:hypothetical protein FACS1894126_3380 [Alphaproteobacteria bacterium]|nr:hypothetical protein FACS1894126_3380 [Alphaproteobacteria bacterium]